MTHVVQAKVGSVDHASEIDVEGKSGWFFKYATLVEGLAKIIRSSTYPGVREDMVDSSMFVFGELKEGEERCPGCRVGLLEGEVRVARWGRIDVATNHGSTMLEKKVHCC